MTEPLLGYRKIKLRIGIAVMFLLVIVPLTVVMISVLYSQNSELARAMARQLMQSSGEEVVASVTGMIGNMSKALNMSVSFGQAQKQTLRQHESMRPMLELMEGLPEAYSLYFGLEDSGDFHQIVRLSPDIKTFGPNKAPPPAGAKWVIRTINDQSGERRDTHLYASDWGKILKIERSDPTYDPRNRPWYKTAVAANTDKATITDVHMFNGITVPGITLVKPLLTDDGARIGVFGAGISVDALSGFLRKQHISEHSVCFILDEHYRLIGYPDPSKTLTIQNGEPVVVAGEQMDDPVIANVVTAYKEHAQQDFSFEANQQVWLAHFQAFPDSFGRKWIMGVVAAEDDFIGPIKHISYMIVLIGLAFIVVATLGMIWLSRLLVEPIHRLIQETEKIREFDLDGKVDVPTMALELDELATAVGSMKAGLSSFGRYVPKSLVQQIVQSGSTTEIGGSRRPLTVMFSDLQGFTKASESMDPEEILRWLSAYFEQMTQAIISHQGTIDKYIGDAVMAMWNAPQEDENHIAHACQGMLACKAAVHSLENAASYGPALVTRMGLHTGIAMVGNVGSSDRMQYTALGAMVNLASRIEGLNKKFGTELLVTEPVYQAVKELFLFRPFGAIVVSGASIPLHVYELIGTREADAPGLNEWMEAFSAWKNRDWATAISRFAAYQRAYPHDLAAGILIGQAEHFAEHGVPDDWDGALHFSSK